MVAFGHPLNEYPFKIFSKKNYLKRILSNKERIPSTIKIKYILLFDWIEQLLIEVPPWRQISNFIYYISTILVSIQIFSQKYFSQRKREYSQHFKSNILCLKYVKNQYPTHFPISNISQRKREYILLEIYM